MSDTEGNNTSNFHLSAEAHASCAINHPLPSARLPTSPLAHWCSCVHPPTARPETRSPSQTPQSPARCGGWSGSVSTSIYSPCESQGPHPTHRDTRNAPAGCPPPSHRGFGTALVASSAAPGASRTPPPTCAYACMCVCMRVYACLWALGRCGMA
jgi:hypothetical protein